MVEQRGKKYHRERVREGLKEEIESILEGELADPRIGLVNVQDLILAADGKSARVFVAVHDSDADLDETLEGLNAAKGFIRHEVGKRMGLRQSPELHFSVVGSDRLESRVDELLQRERKRKRKTEDQG